MAHPDFGRLVNPISTRGKDYAHLITGTPGFSDLPTALTTSYHPQSNRMVKHLIINKQKNIAKYASILHIWNIVISENSSGSLWRELKKPLGIKSNFEWSTHIEKTVIELKKSIGLLKRIGKKNPKEKLFIIAEAIFNCKI